MKYELQILRRNENEKDFQLVNTFESEDENTVLKQYIKALKQYTFKKNFYNITKAKHTKKAYSNIETIEILYCNEYHNGNVYFKYVYKFENVDN